MYFKLLHRFLLIIIKQIEGLNKTIQFLHYFYLKKTQLQSFLINCDVYCK